MKKNDVLSWIPPYVARWKRQERRNLLQNNSFGLWSFMLWSFMLWMLLLFINRTALDCWQSIGLCEVKTYLPVQIRRRGATLILRRTGMCLCNGSLFHKKSLNIGPIFYKKKQQQQKQPKYGSVIPKYWKLWKMGLYFEKNP